MFNRFLQTSVFVLLVVSLFSRCNGYSYQASTSGDYTILDSTLVADDSKLEGIIAPYDDGLSAEMTRVINTSEVAMVKARPEGLLSNFVADLILEEVNELDGFQADFCLLNHGGLRAALPKGNIKVETIYELMPFDNEAVVLTLTGKKVLEIAEYLKIKGGEPVSQLTLDLNDLVSLKINGSTVDADATYKVVTSDYLANGGDKMVFFANPLQRESTSLKIRDLIIEHIEEEQAAGNTLNSALDGRISE
ncbi:MAG: 5'-nucleotidase C-terminal domain-containing protein [Flavobacteriales bacterium]